MKSLYRFFKPKQVLTGKVSGFEVRFFNQTPGRIKALVLGVFMLTTWNVFAQTPVANFTTNPAYNINDTLVVCQNKPVIFTNTSTQTIAGTTYSWSFGFGASPSTNSTSGPVSVSYTSAPNVVSATLTVDNHNGTGPVQRLIHVKVIVGVSSSLSLASSGSGFGTSIQNGITTFKKCGATDSSVFTFTVTPGSSTNQTFNWGDGTTSTQADISGGTISHKFGAGQYNVVHSVNGGTGCSLDKSYIVFNGIGPSITISGSSQSLCNNSPFTFSITSNKVPIHYTINFSDGSNPTTFLTSLDTTVSHSFKNSSCGTDMPSIPVIQNAYSGSITAENSCGSTVFIIGPVFVSQKPTTIFNVVDSPYCQGAKLSVINTSDPGQMVDATACNTDHGTYWKVVPATGFTVITGDLGNNNGFIGNNLDYTKWQNASQTLDMRFTDTGVFTIWLYEANSCGIDSFAKVLHILPGSTITLSKSSQSICSGDTTLAVTATSSLPGASIRWYIQDSLNILSVNNPSGTGSSPLVFPRMILKTRDPGQGFLNLVFTSGCVINNDTIHTILVNELAKVITTIQDTLICSDTKVNIGLNSNTPIGQINWTSSANPTLVGHTNSNGNLIDDYLQNKSNTLDTVAYTISMSGVACPPKDTIIHIWVQPQISIDSIPNISFCPQTLVTIPAFVVNPAGALVTWNNSDTMVGLGFNGTGNIPSWISPKDNDAKNYISVVTVTASLNGCLSNPRSFNLQLHPVPVVLFTLNPANGLFCNADTGSILANVNAVSSSYIWRGPGILGDSTQQRVVVSKPGYYYVYFTENFYSCSSFDSTLVTAPDSLSFVGSLITKNTCYGDSTGKVELFLNQDPTNIDFYWKPSVANKSFTSNLKAGHYEVVAINKVGCIDTTDFDITQPDPITLNLLDSSSGDCGQGNGFLAVQAIGGNGGYSYLWNNKKVSSKISGLGGGTFTVHVTDQQGCTGQASYFLYCSPWVPPKTPQFMSPNGDGKNDYWVVENLELYPDNSLEIYNRWGNLVFKAHPYNNDWDGRDIGSGTNDKLPAGTYFYILDTKVLDQPVRGFIEIQP